MNKVEGGFTTKKKSTFTMYSIPLAISTKHHILCFLYKLIKSNRGVETGFRMVTVSAMHYFHCISIHSLNRSHPHISNRKADER